MSVAPSISVPERAKIDALIQAYEQQTTPIGLFRDQFLLALTASSRLSKHVHSLRSRLKHRDHLRDKLERKLLKCKVVGQPFDITTTNLTLKINDLVGIRVLHLYTRQIREIDAALREIFHDGQYELLEGPFARTWDDESREYFRECGIQTQDSPSLYTSVHYVIGSASRARVTAEIQVRTLMEEVWGEVDHELNYPHKTTSVACAEQLKVLARVTSSATRLVDSIFLTIADHRKTANASTKAPSGTRKATKSRSRRNATPGKSSRNLSTRPPTRRSRR